MRKLGWYVAALGVACDGCGGSDPAQEDYRSWDVTIAFASVSPGSQTSACLGESCTPVRAAGSDGRANWGTVARFGRSQLERGVPFVVTSSTGTALCPPRTLRFDVEDFEAGRKALLCEGIAVQFYLAAAAP